MILTMAKKNEAASILGPAKRMYDTCDTSHSNKKDLIEDSFCLEVDVQVLNLVVSNSVTP